MTMDSAADRLALRLMAVVISLLAFCHHAAAQGMTFDKEPLTVMTHPGGMSSLLTSQPISHRPSLDCVTTRNCRRMKGSSLSCHAPRQGRCQSRRKMSR